MNICPYGFRIVGATDEARGLIVHATAFSAYCFCDARADVMRESYLSAFTFGDDFRALLESTGSPRGFDGNCWSPWLWFDIDRKDNLDAALTNACRLAHTLADRYRLDDDALLLFFSGSKGFHVGLPTSLWVPDPSPTFNRTIRRLAEALAGLAGAAIDTGTYDRVRPFRAPNSRHPKTGLHKRRLSLDELTGLSLDGIRQFAQAPAPFDLPNPPPPNEAALADWRGASEAVRKEGEARDRRQADGGPASVNRLTLEFIRGGAGEGDRHRLLYSAARNLAEMGCPLAALDALLTEPGRDCGLCPRDVARQIRCGFDDAGKPAADSPPSSPPPDPSPSPSNRPDVRDQLAALWNTAPADADDGEHGDAREPPEDRLTRVDLDERGQVQ